MESYTELIFNSPTGLVQFNINNDVCIDPNTNEPFKYAVVHGNTWQTTLHSELPDYGEAFTPGIQGFEHMNHRGIYVYNSEENMYSKFKYQEVDEPIEPFQVSEDWKPFYWDNSNGSSNTNQA